MNLFINCTLLLVFIFLPMSLQRIECDLPRIPHGMVRLKLRSKIAKFSCRSYYTLVGNKYSACTINRDWDEPIPVCVKAGCPKIQISENRHVSELHHGAWLVFFCLPKHRLIGSPVLYCDGEKWNGTAPICEGTEVPVKTSCDFESSDLCGWRQDDLHDFDWLQWSSKTPSYFIKTGPLFDHTMGNNSVGKYMYIESTGRQLNNTGRLLSPFYPAKMSENGCFSLYYHMYGKTVGGLRVYQKPATLDLSELISNTGDESRKYLLFEKWGNQGDYWYRNVSRLKKSVTDFQIVIEGIMGSSFAGDAAIDDVAILQGNECETATVESVTPPSRYETESCENRCGLPSYGRDCDCEPVCIDRENCCVDYLETCTGSDASDVSLTETTLEIKEPENAAGPQTQKLTATRSTTIKSTTMTTTSSARTSTTQTSTSKRTTPKLTSSSTTTSKPTTKKTKPTLVFKTSTKVYKATDLNKDEILNVETSSTTETAVFKTTAKKTTAKVISTTENHGVSRTIENHNEYHKLVEKARDAKRVSQSSGRSRDAVKSSSNTSLIVTVLLLMISASIVGTVIALRSSRGQAALAKWSRRRSDQEVRYLTSSVDEDDS